MSQIGDQLEHGKIRYIHSYFDNKLQSTQKEITIPYVPRDLMEAHAIIFDVTSKLISKGKAKKHINIQVDLDENPRNSIVRRLHITHLEDVDNNKTSQ